ncbi:type I restriction-modification system DNA methylase subunit [Lachnospiraceae bacterium PFB1-21]
MIGRKEFYEIAGVSQHSEFEKYLSDLIFTKAPREDFYREIMARGADFETDTFRNYFEEYSAERKSNMQDYTPDALAILLANLANGSGEEKYSAYDPTAGTGALLIQKWVVDGKSDERLYRADELADNAIPYLLHNLAMRGINADVVHGNVLTREVKTVYRLRAQIIEFSIISKYPRNDETMKDFKITRWKEE